MITGEINRELRNKGQHRWEKLEAEAPYHIKQDTCRHCEIRRRRWYNEKLKWTETEYVNTTTGEIHKTIKCKTKQITIWKQ